MLKDKLEPNQTYTLKLVSGEEIIARFISSDMLNYVVSKPVACVLSPQGMGLTQWVMTANMDSNFNIPIASVLYIGKTRKDIADQYISSTTGIKPATAGIIAQ